MTRWNRLIQASGLTGPIPSGISLLTSLIDLLVYLVFIYKYKTISEMWNLCSWSILTCRRITDLSGPESPIPLLDKMKNMKTLWVNGSMTQNFRLYRKSSINSKLWCFCCRMLRSCNLVGRLPPYLGQMAKLEFQVALLV